MNIELYKRLKKNIDEAMTTYQEQTNKLPNSMEYDPLVIKNLLDDLFKLYNQQTQKAIECLKEVKEYLKLHCEYTVKDKIGWYLPENKIDVLIDTKIKELEGEKE